MKLSFQGSIYLNEAEKKTGKPNAFCVSPFLRWYKPDQVPDHIVILQLHCDQGFANFLEHLSPYGHPLEVYLFLLPFMTNNQEIVYSSIYSANL